MNNAPLVSIITVNYNHAAVTADMLRSLSRLQYPNYEVIVVDNASAEASVWLKKEFPFIIYVASPTNGGFAAGNNLGLQYAKGEYAFFINNDTEVTPHLLTTLVAYMQQHPRCAIACPKIKFYHQPDTIQYAGATGLHPLTSRSYDIGFNQKDTGGFDETRRTDLPNGAAMMVPMKLIMQHGSMSENFFLYYEELDWAARFKAMGYEVHYVGTTTIFHKESVSTGKNSPFKTYYLYRNRLLYIRRNYRLLKQLISIGFFVGVSMPVHLAKHAVRGEWEHAKAIWQGLHWNLRHCPFPNANDKSSDSPRQLATA
jgi:GT2 family glycosyltransferase